MTTDYKVELQRLPGATQFIHQRDGYWMSASNLDVRSLAQSMQKWGARLSTMTASVLPGDELEVIYHLLLDGEAYNFKVIAQNNSLPSISSILAAADWIEREIQDLYGVEFTNHPHPQRLILPAQMKPGLFREMGGAPEKIRR